MGIGQTAFYSKELSTSGVVVGGIFRQVKNPESNVKKPRERRTTQPLSKNISNQNVLEKPNPLTFGLLDF